MSNYSYTRKWFHRRNRRTFEQFILPEWAGKKIVYLELGVFEGQSMVWMMENVLTHPEAKAVGVDPWLMTRKLDGSVMEDVLRRAAENLSEWLYPLDSTTDNWKLRLIRGNSAEVLRKMLTDKGGFAGIGKRSVDLCMVDGNHNALAVLDDLQLVYKLVKPGGWILMDDVENDHKKKDHVKDGLATFLKERPIKMLWKHRYMECYER